MLFLDDVYVTADGGPFILRVEPPTSVEMEKLIHESVIAYGSLSGASRAAGAGHGELLPDTGSARWRGDVCRIVAVLSDSVFI